MTFSDPVPALRDALKFSPDNVPLRLHLAETLLNRGEAEAAETEYEGALKLDPRNTAAQFGLARSLFQLGEFSTTLELLDRLTAQPNPEAAWLSLHARVLLQTEDMTRAAQQFRRAAEQDESLNSSDLADQLAAVPVFGSVGQQAEDQSIERPKLTFADVGGMEELKEQIRLKIIYPLANAELFKAYGKAIGGGILMYGPPGCGKTHIARATAGEIQANFISVGLNDVLDMWLGNSERNLHELFDRARRNSPCVLFFDEADALAASRSDFRQSNSRMIINQFLMELDGVEYSNEGVLILAATNTPWHLDSAFRRPGRFDRILFVPPPDQIARSAILRLLCKGKPVSDIDFDPIAKKAKDFSGADLKAIVDVAVERKLQEAMKTGRPQPLTTKDLINAVQAVKPSTREWFSSARNYAVHANQDGTYNDILDYLK
ncbi:AAA family ATPase [Leptolyngbya sp. NIES-2104]|uniref:AAA family ATPase n=1 Tax=Leptolyngbya sp. NIES-2104 TaxID=1552121 RepID=UPI0006ECB26D|nr:AAA family ATPase [Leptolyngbya sp. NIES-2104]GAP97707.1 cell division protein FtsH [Leptolyngbya sp. NIES-2104]